MTAIRKLADIARAAAAPAHGAQPYGQAAPAQFETEVRAFVRREYTFRPRPPADYGGGREAAGQMHALIERVAGGSVREIDHVIDELHGIRETLRQEGMRLQRELADYAALSHTATASMRIVAENIARWRPPAAQLRYDGSSRY